MLYFQGDKMHSDREVIGLYFSSGLKDSDEAPRFVNRITKGILARSDSCVVVQLKSSQIHDPSKLAVGVSSQYFRRLFSHVRYCCCDISDNESWKRYIVHNGRLRGSCGGMR